MQFGYMTAVDNLDWCSTVISIRWWRWWKNAAKPEQENQRQRKQRILRSRSWQLNKKRIWRTQDVWAVETGRELSEGWRKWYARQERITETLQRDAGKMKNEKWRKKTSRRRVSLKEMEAESRVEWTKRLTDRLIECRKGNLNAFTQIREVDAAGSRGSGWRTQRRSYKDHEKKFRLRLEEYLRSKEKKWNCWKPCHRSCSLAIRREADWIFLSGWAVINRKK